MADSKFHQPVVGRRAFIGGSLAASSLAFLAACGKKGGDASDSGSAKGGTLNYYLNNPVSIDPYNAQEDQGTQVCFQLFDSLTNYDYDKKEIVPLAAESWKANDDATEFTFKLKKAKFHNGEKVTSKSFKRGWERIVNTKSKVATAYTPSEISYHLSLVEGYQDLVDGKATELKGVSCPDDSTFVVKLSKSYADFPYVCSHPALAPVPEAAESDAKNYYLAPIGNGPFQMDGKWKDGQEINLKKFDGYYGDHKAKVDSIHFAIIKDVETAWKEFQAGNLDVCDVPVAQIAAAKKDRGVSKDGYTMSDGQRMLLGGEPSTYYLTCNNNKAPFDNEDFRKGVSLAINREAICKTIFKGSRTPADGIIPPGIAGYKKGAWEFSKYDVDEAKKYLDKAGYKANAQGDRGITVTLSYNQDGGHKEIMESVIGDLKKVGIDVHSDTPEWKAVLQKYSDGDYQFGRLGWVADYPIMDNFLYPLFHSDSIGGDNKSGFKNAEVDEKINEARTTIDDDKRLELMHEADKAVSEHMPVIPLMFYSHVTAGSDRIKKFYMDPQKHAYINTTELNA